MGVGIRGEEIDRSVQMISEKGKEVDRHGDERLKLILIPGYSKDHAKMQNIFDQYEQQNRDWNVIVRAEKTIQKR